MAQPEKEPKDASKKQPGRPEPKLDAIIPNPADKPDNMPPAAAELIEDIDSYQEKMEKQWESAKSSYEKKINQIMEDFLKKELPTAEELEKSTPRPKYSDREAEAASHLEGLMARVQRELHESDLKSKKFSLGGAKPRLINMSWQPDFMDMSRRWKALGKLAVAVLVMGSIYSFVTGLPKTTKLPYSRTLGPVVMDGHVYIMDWFRKGLFVHKLSFGLPIVSVENVPSNLSTGLALSNKFLYTCDGVGKTISRHNLSSDHDVAGSLEAPGDRPVGLYFDGMDLWSGDPITRRIYRHRGNELEDIREEYPVPDEVNLASFFLFKNRVWILDGKSRLLHIYRLQKPLKPLASVDLDRFLKGATPTGAALSKGKIFLVTENPSTLVQIPVRTLKKSAVIVEKIDWLD